MSNFQISLFVKNCLVDVAGSLTTRYSTAAAQAFPLGVTDVQRMILPDEAVESARETARLGVEIEKYHAAIATVAMKEPHERWVDINIQGSPELYLPSRMWLYNDSRYRKYFSVDRLSQDLQDKFYTWLKRALQARQLKTLTDATINKFIHSHAPTMYHLLARWPALAILPGYIRDRKDRDLWTKRFHSAPPANKLRRWGWDYTQPEHSAWRLYEKRMKLAETVLAAATVLPVDPPIPEISASITDWQKLEWENY